MVAFISGFFSEGASTASQRLTSPGSDCRPTRCDESFSISYTIVTLRKCTRGPPLLPRVAASNQEINWEVQSVPRLLTDYLREFCTRLGLPELTVQSTLQGRHLVPYQAAVPEAEWKTAWQRLEPYFREQKAAYRQLRGGTSAPEFTVGSTPRFVSGEWSPQQNLRQELSGECDRFTKATLLEPMFVNVELLATDFGRPQQWQL
jgi:hypothetical protein